MRCLPARQCRCCHRRQGDHATGLGQTPIFHTVSEARSFTRAGTLLNLSQSAVSRQISALEESLNTPLFHRHARGLILTEHGEFLYSTVHEVFAKLSMAEAILQDARDSPQGTLRVTAPVGFGSFWLAPRIRAFVDAYPKIRAMVLLDDRELDLSMREADVAVRLHKPTQPDLVQRRLMSVHVHACASRDYVAQHGMPHTIDELDQHRLIIYGDNAPETLSGVNWLAELGRPPSRPREAVLWINNIYGLAQAVASGLGIAGIPDYISRDRPDIVRVLPEIDGPTFETYFVYPEELRNSKKIQVFRDFLIGAVTDTEF